MTGISIHCNVRLICLRREWRRLRLQPSPCLPPPFPPLAPTLTSQKMYVAVPSRNQTLLPCMHVQRNQSCHSVTFTCHLFVCTKLPTQLPNYSPSYSITIFLYKQMFKHLYPGKSYTLKESVVDYLLKKYVIYRAISLNWQGNTNISLLD